MKKAKLSAIRAVAAVMIKKYLLRLILVISLLLLAALAIITVLSFTHSAWWFLLSIMLCLPLSILLLGYLLCRYVVSKIQPRHLSRTETRSINDLISTVGTGYAIKQGIKKSPLGIAVTITWSYLRKKEDDSSAIIVQPLEEAVKARDQFKKIASYFE